MYLPGDTVLITDIGVFTSVTADGAGSSLVCVTRNVNTECCTGRDNPNGGAVGKWHFPDGTIVPRYSVDPNADFSRSGFTQQVRLNRRNNAMSPTGAYECRVPPLGGGALVSASITIINGKSGQWCPLRVGSGVAKLMICVTSFWPNILK